MSRHHAIEATLRGFTRALSHSLISEQTARKAGLLQGVDPRARVAGVLLLVIAAAVCRRTEVVGVLLALAVVIALLSRISPRVLLLRVWLVAFGFTGVIALPALFTTPGAPIAHVGPLTVSATGARAALLLILRVETAMTLSTALVLSTPWMHILKALRQLGVPAVVTAMLAMTYRYIFLLIETAQQMFESRQSRILGTLSGAEQRRLAARTAGVLMSKSIDLSGEVYLAMQSRGFRGGIELLHQFRFRLRDAFLLALFSAAAFSAMWFGR